MNNIPIRQTILATLAFSFSNWQKLLEVSIFPLLAAIPFITILPELMVILQAQLFGVGEVQEYPRFYELYLLMFDYAYMALIINIYRLVVSGDKFSCKTWSRFSKSKVGSFFSIILIFVNSNTVSNFHFTFFSPYCLFPTHSHVT